MLVNSNEMDNKDKQNIFFGFVSGVLIGVLMLLIFIEPEQPKKNSLMPVTAPKISSTIYSDITLDAKAAIVYRPSTGEVLYSKNKDIQLPLASIAKIMSAIIAKENLPEGTQISFVESFWKLGDILNYALMVSSNEATSVLAATAGALDGSIINPQASFIKKMNNKASNLGLFQTYFLDEAGLDVSDTQSGAYGSASDVANMFAYALRVIPSTLEATTVSDTWFNTSTEPQMAVNTNKAIGMIPGLIAGKTGFTNLAGGNLVVAFDTGLSDPIIAVVLGSTKEGRFSDIEKLVNATLKQQRSQENQAN